MIDFIQLLISERQAFCHIAYHFLLYSDFTAHKSFILMKTVPQVPLDNKNVSKIFISVYTLKL